MQEFQKGNMLKEQVVKETVIKALNDCKPIVIFVQGENYEYAEFDNVFAALEYLDITGGGYFLTHAQWVMHVIDKLFFIDSTGVIRSAFYVLTNFVRLEKELQGKGVVLHTSPRPLKVIKGQKTGGENKTDNGTIYWDTFISIKDILYSQDLTASEKVKAIKEEVKTEECSRTVYAEHKGDIGYDEHGYREQDDVFYNGVGALIDAYDSAEVRYVDKNAEREAYQKKIMETYDKWHKNR